MNWLGLNKQRGLVRNIIQEGSSLAAFQAANKTLHY